MQPAPAVKAASAAVPAGRKVFVTDDRTGLSQAVLAEFGNMGINAVLVSVDILKFKKDLPPAAGLVIIQNPLSATMEADLKNAFELTHAMAADLTDSAKRQAAFFTTVTRMDGALGFGSGPIANPIQGALAGLAKTAAAEWPEVVCHAVDIAPAWTSLRDVARALIREVTTPGPVEIGLTESSRSTCSPATRSLSAAVRAVSPRSAPWSWPAASSRRSFCWAVRPSRCPNRSGWAGSRRKPISRRPCCRPSLMPPPPDRRMWKSA